MQFKQFSAPPKKDTDLTLGKEKKKGQSESLPYRDVGCQIHSFFNHRIIWKTAIYKLTKYLKALESSKSIQLPWESNNFTLR